MKITINSRVLKSALETTAKAIPSKPSIPILANFLFKADGTILTITGSDADITIVSEIPNEAKGEACLPLQLLELVRTLPDDLVTITTAETGCTVEWNNGKSTLPAFGVTDYPEIPSPQDEMDAVIPAEEFGIAMAHAIPCVGTDDLRPIMSGVLFKSGDGVIDIVASDSKILSIYKVATKCRDFDFVISANALKAVGSGDVEIYTDDARCFLRTGNTLVIARKIIGKFPNYTAVIPKEFNAKLTAKKKDIIDTVKRVSVCASKASNHIKLSLGVLGCSVEAEDLSFATSAKETPDGLTFDGADLTIGFRGDYIIKGVGAVNSQDIAIHFTDARHAAVITSEDDPCTILLMPVQI